MWEAEGVMRGMKTMQRGLDEPLITLLMLACIPDDPDRSVASLLSSQNGKGARRVRPSLTTKASKGQLEQLD